MSHPPIPPKSKYFLVSYNGEFYFRFVLDCGFAIKESMTLHKGDRGVIAAVAEVEFRMRAERWDGLKSKADSRHTYAVFNLSEDVCEFWRLRTKKYLSQQCICERAAFDWRVWGLQK